MLLDLYVVHKKIWLIACHFSLSIGNPARQAIIFCFSQTHYKRAGFLKAAVCLNACGRNC